MSKASSLSKWIAMAIVAATVGCSWGPTQVALVTIHEIEKSELDRLQAERQQIEARYANQIAQFQAGASATTSNTSSELAQLETARGQELAVIDRKIGDQQPRVDAARKAIERHRS